MNKACSVAAMALALAGCGGGGGGGGGGSSGGGGQTLQSAPASQALTRFFSNQQAATLTASQGGYTYKIQLALQPQGATTFNGMPAQTALVTENLFQNGTLVATSATTHYVNYGDPSAFELLGSVDSTGVPYEVYDSPGLIPSQVSVGQSGSVGNITIYHDSSQTTQDATTLETYSVKPHDASTLLFCLNDEQENVTQQGQSDGLTNGTESTCFAIDSAGNASLFSDSIYIPGQGSLTFR